MRARSIAASASNFSPVAYRVNDTLFHSFLVNMGGVIEDKSGGSRFLGVEARVGSGKFDNTHPMRDNLDFTNWDGYQNVRLPMEPEGILAEKTLKIATDFAFRAAKDQFIKIKANVGVRPAEDDTGLDFASAPTVKHREPDLQPLPPRKSLDSLYARIKRALAQNKSATSPARTNFDPGSAPTNTRGSAGGPIFHSRADQPIDPRSYAHQAPRASPAKSLRASRKSVTSIPRWIRC